MQHLGFAQSVTGTQLNSDLWTEVTAVLSFSVHIHRYGGKCTCFMRISVKAFLRLMELLSTHISTVEDLHWGQPINVVQMFPFEIAFTLS